ncbi:MAG TPA: aminotransferase class I/II-fold pyridoxal phosphate-dependent enzyme [Candidatus Krumholzibacteria bacterium]|nr:aminotransferase class I/II-fold pyridoxal phosphate-dependent enzyme [Candidatus Krumholzibacteria bacterium]
MQPTTDPTASAKALPTTFNPAMEDIRMSPIVSISEEARQRAVDYERTGNRFVFFQRGEIDFPTPKFIVDAAKRGLDEGLTKYPKSGGEGFFRDAVVRRLKIDHDADLDASHVIGTYGGQEGLELSFKLFKRGAGFSPTWSCALENFVPFAQIDFAEVPLNGDFSVDLDRVEDAVRGRDFFYLNNPQNPTGKVFTPEELKAIVDICTRHGVFVIADEAYEKIIYEGQHFSLAKLDQENIITVFTMSKAFSMTGWRLGYAVTRNAKVARLLRLGNYTQTAGVTTFLQFAAAEALNNVSESRKAIATMLDEFRRRRDTLNEGIKDLPGITADRPAGAFYMFPNFTAVIPHNLAGEERNHYIYRMLLENGIATVYGSCFGHHFTDNVRLSFSATPVPVINDAVERLRRIFA